MYLSALAFATPVTINMQTGVRASLETGYLRAEISIFSEEPISGKRAALSPVWAFYYFLVGFESASSVRSVPDGTFPKSVGRHFTYPSWEKPIENIWKGEEVCWNDPGRRLDGASVFKEEKSDLDFFF